MWNIKHFDTVEQLKDFYDTHAGRYIIERIYVDNKNYSVEYIKLRRMK